MDKVREKALNIALNKITGAWDEDLLAQLLEDIQNSDFDLGKTGFDGVEEIQSRRLWLFVCGFQMRGKPLFFE